MENLIGGTWPGGGGSLHIGYLTALLPGGAQSRRSGVGPDSEHRQDEMMDGERGACCLGRLGLEYRKYVSRNLAFLCDHFGGQIPEGQLAPEVEREIRRLYGSVGEKIENDRFREAQEELLHFVCLGSEHFDAEARWNAQGENALGDGIAACENTLFNCVQIISNLAVLLGPFFPRLSEVVCSQLSIFPEWGPQLACGVCAK